MVYINCYTNKYKPLALNLVKSLDKLGLKHEVTEFPSKGSWVSNCNYKAQYIQDMWTKHGKVVWIDADAEVKEDPALFEFIDYDIGYHLFKDKEVLSGTLFFNDTQGACDILDAWVKENSKHSSVWDQKNLATVLKTVEHKEFLLPPEYCWIFDLSRKHYGNLKPVIEHYQASRRLKK
jgi:hypothetical protein